VLAVGAIVFECLSQRCAFLSACCAG
jgi:hypothetical protein